LGYPGGFTETDSHREKETRTQTEIKRGNITIDYAKLDLEAHSAEVGYQLGKPWWGIME
jgi:hypothetical protein